MGTSRGRFDTFPLCPDFFHFCTLQKCLFCRCAALAFSWVGSRYLSLENCSPSCCVCFAKLVPIHLSVPGFTQMNTQALPRLRQVVYIHDRTSNRSFFVNTTLPRKSCEDAHILREGETGEDMRLTSGGWTDCTSLEGTPMLVSIDTSLPLSVIECGLGPCCR